MQAPSLTPCGTCGLNLSGPKYGGLVAIWPWPEIRVVGKDYFAGPGPVPPVAPPPPPVALPPPPVAPPPPPGAPPPPPVPDIPPPAPVPGAAPPPGLLSSPVQPSGRIAPRIDTAIAPRIAFLIFMSTPSLVGLRNVGGRPRPVGGGSLTSRTAGSGGRKRGRVDTVTAVGRPPVSSVPRGHAGVRPPSDPASIMPTAGIRGVEVG
jgi:hypothetical protein